MHALDFPKMNAATYLPRPSQSIMGRWRMTTMLSCPPSEAFPSFFPFGASDFGLSITSLWPGWLGRTCCILVTWQAHHYSSHNLKKCESSALWRTKGCQWPPGKHHYKMPDGSCPKYATLWKMMARMLIPSRLPWGSSHGINWVTWRWMVVLSSNMEYSAIFHLS